MTQLMSGGIKYQYTLEFTEIKLWPRNVYIKQSNVINLQYSLISPGMGYWQREYSSFWSLYQSVRLSYGTLFPLSLTSLHRRTVLYGSWQPSMIFHPFPFPPGGESRKFPSYRDDHGTKTWRSKVLTVCYLQTIKFGE